MRCHPLDCPPAIERASTSCRTALERLGLGLGLLCISATVVAGKAHEHGAVRLDVAVEAAAVNLNVELPLDSLLGFERTPRTEAERQAAAAALAKMRDGRALFRFDAAAHCTLASVRVDAPVLEPGAKAATAGEHAELEASYVFSCAQPARLAALEVLLFDAFKRVERVEVQAVLPHGQHKAVLRRAARVLRLAK
jgi:hypothetical protein